MAHTFQAIISKIDGPVYIGETISLTVPGTEGELTVMANHEPFITALKEGTITVKPAEGEPQTFSIHKGVLEVTAKEAIVLL